MSGTAGTVGPVRDGHAGGDPQQRVVETEAEGVAVPVKGVASGAWRVESEVSDCNGRTQRDRAGRTGTRADDGEIFGQDAVAPVRVDVRAVPPVGVGRVRRPGPGTVLGTCCSRVRIPGVGCGCLGHGGADPDGRRHKQNTHPVHHILLLYWRPIAWSG